METTKRATIEAWLKKNPQGTFSEFLTAKRLTRETAPCTPSWFGRIKRTLNEDYEYKEVTNYNCKKVTNYKALYLQERSAKKIALKRLSEAEYVAWKLKGEYYQFIDRLLEEESRSDSNLDSSEESRLEEEG